MYNCRIKKKMEIKNYKKQLVQNKKKSNKEFKMFIVLKVKN